MSNSFGMPGPGGSLGQCALCGKSFLTEILLGQSVSSFTVPGCEQDLYGHADCLKTFNGTQFCNLPEASPLRQAWEANKPDLNQP